MGEWTVQHILASTIVFGSLLEYQFSSVQSLQSCPTLWLIKKNIAPSWVVDAERRCQIPARGQTQSQGKVRVTAKDSSSLRVRSTQTEFHLWHQSHTICLEFNLPCHIASDLIHLKSNLANLRPMLSSAYKVSLSLNTCWSCPHNQIRSTEGDMVWV